VKAFHGLWAVGGWALLVIGCATSSGLQASPARQKARAPVYGDGDGLSCETRVIVRARTEPGGVAAEHNWLYTRYPGYTMQNQSLGQCGESAADIVSIKTSDGRTLEIHFDISSFFTSA
jgi:hypothetical protein